MNLHESIVHTKKEIIIKESSGFRLRLIKHEVISPTGLISINLINETLCNTGEVTDSSTYNFFMTKEELQTLAQGLIA